ncbi:MAG: ABC transporter permease [Ruminiclostridium sp.]
MLFLVITFSFGLFSANTARAINNNKSDRIYYSNGADITLSEYWTETSSTEENQTTTEYTERDFSRYENLAGVEQATKVLKNKKVKFTFDGKTTEDVMLMGIQPDRFAQVAWFRNDLLPVHWYNYCNALTDYKSGVLVSASLAEKYEIELGDEVALRWGGNDTVGATVLAIVDYWPGINPNDTPDFAVMNYNYCYTETKLEPYEVWLKLADGATSEELYADISAKRMPVEWLKDSSQLLIAEKNEPQLQGMNGALTLGFIIIMIMTIIGFLIYWILSIKSRTLQFGILRAMGVTFKEIIGMIGYEQILVSGVSIAIAFVIGGMASDLFVPLFQMMYDVVDQIPPFYVSASASDYIKIYAIIVLMLGGGFAILGSIIKKININKALKLGED